MDHTRMELMLMKHRQLLNKIFIKIKKENWRINHFNNAKAIRLGENSLLELAKINNNIKPVILRTSGIWNDDIMKSSINFLSNRTYIKK